MPKSAFVIPNYNGKKILEKCLASIKEQILAPDVVLVVDNASHDGSCEMIKRKFPEVQVIKLKTNTGFAKASNLGFEQALAQGCEYICPLNNDIVLDKNYLKELVTMAESYQKREKKLGIIGAKLYFMDDPEIINTVGTLIYKDGSGMERGFKEKDIFKQQEEIFGSCGAAALYTQEMLTAIAFESKKGEREYFDNSFFAYYEDLDLNYRARLLGFHNYFNPQAFGYHKHSATGKSFSAFKSYQVHRNQYFVIIKNFPLPFLIKGLLFMPIRYIMLVISLVIRKGPAAKLQENLAKDSDRKSMAVIVFRAWWEVVKNLPQLLRKRRVIQKNKKVSNQEFKDWLRRYKADLGKMIYRA